MKPPYLPLILILLLAACSSPDKKNTEQASTLKKDTSILADTATQKKFVYVPSVITDSHITVPPYGLDKVKALVPKIKVIDDTADEFKSTEPLDDKVYNSLSLEEKFTYNMIHPESYSQMCDGLPEHVDPDNRIYGSLQDAFGEYSWSNRQLSFFKDNREAIESLMKPLIEKDNKLGNNMKEAIIEMNATDMIPYLIEVYNKEKNDHHILTMLMLLMDNNKYPEFINSISHRKLYAKRDWDYSHPPYLVFNQANEDLIIKRATNFYNSLQTNK